LPSEKKNCLGEYVKKPKILINLDKKKVWDVKATKPVEAVVLDCDDQTVTIPPVFIATDSEVENVLDLAKNLKLYKKKKIPKR
jgi:hypothetical protein